MADKLAWGQAFKRQGGVEMPLTGKENRNPIIFKSFLISFLSILIIPIVLSSLTYYEAANIVEKQSREARLSVLEQARDIIDKNWTDIDETSIRLSFDSRLSALFNLHAPLENSPALFDVWNYSKDVRSLSLTGSAFKNTFFIILKNSDLVFSKVQTSDSTKAFYSDVFHYSDMPYDEWRSLLFRARHFRDVLPARPAVLDGAETSVITYMTTLPLGANQESQCVIVFTIEEKEIRKLAGQGGGSFAIVDGNGALITSDPGVRMPQKLTAMADQRGYLHDNVSGENQLFVYTRSSYNNWTYVSSVPIAEVMGKVYYIRKIALLVATATLIVGIVISLLMAYRHSRPIKEIVALLRAFWGNDHPDSKVIVLDKSNAVAYLRGSIARLIDNNQTMRDALQRQADALKNVFVERLFKGEFDDRAHMYAMLAHVGLEMRGSAFAIAVLKIYKQNDSLNTDILDELSVFRALIEDAVRKHIQDDGYLHVMTENELAILLKSDMSDKAEFTASFAAVFQAVSSEIKERYVIAPMIGIGNVYADLLDVHYSFQEARQAVDSIHSTGRNDAAIVWYSQIEQAHTGYYYPPEMEIRLMNIVKAGNAAELQQVLNHIHHENFVAKTLPGSVQQHLLHDIRATVLKLMDEIGRHTPLDTAQSHAAAFDGIDGIDKELHDVFAQLHLLCRSVEKKKKSHNTRLMDKITAYMNENFQDSNMSLYAVASQFNLSESYLSQFFKEQSGETFSAYLERLRISLACQLIASDSLSIDRIASQTGYNSTHSFRRAFKRVMGVSPSSYKQ